MKNYFLIAVIILFLFGCEEEVKLKLKTSEPLVFIEGNVRSDSLYQTVTVRRTMNFQETGDYPGVVGATVILSDDSGRIDTLQEIKPGVYRTSKLFEGIPLRNYFLKVQTIENQLYEAKSFLPDVVAFDTLIAQYVDNTSIVREPGYYLTTVGREPGGIVNYYRVLCYKNDSLFNGGGDYFITDDILVDGNLIINALPFKFDKNDTAKVELWNMEQKMFYYYISLVKQLFSGGPFAPPADNVKGNISNGALGYFGSCAVYHRTIVIE